MLAGGGLMAGDFERIERLGVWSRRGVLLAGLGAVAAGCVGESYLAQGEVDRLARVLDVDSLALDTCLRVRLAEVKAPAASYGDRAGDPGADAARAVRPGAARVQTYPDNATRKRRLLALEDEARALGGSALVRAGAGRSGERAGICGGGGCGRRAEDKAGRWRCPSGSGRYQV
jgi:hypothetical protein